MTKKYDIVPHANYKYIVQTYFLTLSNPSEY